jgi:acyl-homoserine-lactone acylase
MASMKHSTPMKKLSFVLALALIAPALHAQLAADRTRWAAEAKATTITRDDWGIAHIHGHTDADAVFGMIYAQCEDDFNRVETNYLVSLGRLAESEGESKIWQDLRQRLFIDPLELKRDYAQSPPWLKALMNAWADGINFYLAQHPEVHPHVLTHWEPWMALSFTEGSIGGDIERVNLKQLQDFYDKSNPTTSSTERNPDSALIAMETPARGEQLQSTDGEQGGSNGIAIAPSNTVNHHALLLINPHTSFFFRSELQMSSDEGLNAYGAVTWGQLFIYQGFNDHAGWMHTSSNVDAIDEFVEEVIPPVKTGPNPVKTFTYHYGDTTRPFTHRFIGIRYATPNGMKERTFEPHFDHRGPIIRSEGSKWVSIELMNTPIPALEQSYLRTKAHNYAEYSKTMELFGNSSNNTIFADSDGDIAYWHGNFIPRRDTKFDFTKPVDGSDPATDWQGLLKLSEIPQLHNPASGYLFNVNNAPWWGSGVSSLKKSDFPVYVEQGGESSRGIHAIRLLNGRHDFTPDSLLSSAFDPYLPWFARTIPELLKAYDALPADAPEKAQLKAQIAVLRAWNFHWGYDSIATSLAVYWGEAAGTPVSAAARREHALWEDYFVAHVTPEQMLTSLASASSKLTADFGSWQTKWGDINRFQRINDDITSHFDDSAPSIPVPFTSSAWGSLASFAARAYPNTKKRYGTSGNSFVAVVEFGDRVRARAITAGGESGHPGDKHFDDEAERYASGNFREVYFYSDQLKEHTERIYHPGEQLGTPRL